MPPRSCSPLACVQIAIALSILVPDLPLRMVYDESFLIATPLVPWFIAAMAPLALAAVLVNNILARRKSKNVLTCRSFTSAYCATLGLKSRSRLPMASMWPRTSAWWD